MAHIEDWAWRRRQRYGTITCDLERSRVIDILPERSTEVVAAWLRQYPGVEVIARDRGAGAYAEGARQGAPNAIQVADCWHLLRNLGDAVQGAIDRHRSAVVQAARTVAQTQNAEQVAKAPGALQHKGNTRAGEAAGLPKRAL